MLLAKYFLLDFSAEVVLIALKITLQAFEAARYAGCASHLIPVKMDYERFRAVNTSKGKWSLLDLLSTVKIDISSAASLRTPAAPARELAAPRATTLTLSAVTSIVTEAAAAIIGETIQGD